MKMPGMVDIGQWLGTFTGQEHATVVIDLRALGFLCNDMSRWMKLLRILHSFNLGEMVFKNDFWWRSRCPVWL